MGRDTVQGGRAARRAAPAAAIAPAAALRRQLRAVASQRVARGSLRFFKTGRGQYGAGDRFLGVRVPALRALARCHALLPSGQVLLLLRSVWHEERMLALMILCRQHARGTDAERLRCERLYWRHLRHVNNWDLVDGSAPLLLGSVGAARSARLRRLAASRDLWRRRVAIVATLRDIRSGVYTPTLAVTRRLLGDGHDLIHKACGWMLREVGKREPQLLRGFLRRHASRMPRTMLRYAIERCAPAERRRWLTARAPRRGAG